MRLKKTPSLTLSRDTTADWVTKRTTCNFCPEETEVPQWGNKIVHHLVITIDSKNHCHVHGPIDNKELVVKMIDAAKKECKID
jgi:hypothetical protein